jgi:hypothetical protein
MNKLTTKYTKKNAQIPITIGTQRIENKHPESSSPLCNPVGAHRFSIRFVFAKLGA